MTGTDDERVAKRAYAIWEEEGRPFGRDGDHWQRARHEIEALQAGAPPLEVAAGKATGSVDAGSLEETAVAAIGGDAASAPAKPRRKSRTGTTAEEPRANGRL